MRVLAGTIPKTRNLEFTCKTLLNLTQQNMSHRIKDCIEKFKKSESVILKFSLPFYKYFFHFYSHLYKTRGKGRLIFIAWLYRYIHNSLKFHILKNFITAISKMFYAVMAIVKCHKVLCFRCSVQNSSFFHVKHFEEDGGFLTSNNITWHIAISLMLSHQLQSLSFYPAGRRVPQNTSCRIMFTNGICAEYCWQHFLYFWKTAGVIILLH